jgi:hypothetical protein
MDEALTGEKAMVGRAPKIGRCLDQEKCRGQGYGMGAEDGEAWPETARKGATDRPIVLATAVNDGCGCLRPSQPIFDKNNCIIDQNRV